MILDLNEARLDTPGVSLRRTICLVCLTRLACLGVRGLNLVFCPSG
jgi:hypothetical protein